MSDNTPVPSFSTMGLAAPLVRAVEESGYESPTAIQFECIPYLLEGHDLIGQAQTGTGKTAAFALPLLSRLDTKISTTQVMVLTPTRELAIQVAEAFQHYARHLDNFHVVPLYGGSGYSEQIRSLRRGSQVVVGTPGRLMDHVRKGTLKLGGLKTLVLDEADEMLRMGFIDDVEWVLEQIPDTRQIALFSATMPKEIRRVADRYLKDPKLVKIEVRTLTADSINQRYWLVDGLHKLDALTRMLETEEFGAMIIFVRTKASTEELAGKLLARGYACAALNGDIAQLQRERTIQQIKNGKLDIIVATDVAARGLDVERVTHVVNYDIPTEPEAYVHRIGRTGRAGRTGEAILFVAHRERRLLKAIERTIGRSIPPMELPTAGDVNKLRVERFKNRIRETLATKDLDFFSRLIAEYVETETTDPLLVAAALASMAQGDEPLLVAEQDLHRPRRDRGERGKSNDRSSRREREPRESRGKRRNEGDERKERTSKQDGGGARQDREVREKRPSRSRKQQDDMDMISYRIEVGASHGVKPGNIVGAIANEAGLDGKYIGRIEIHEDYSTIDLPDGMPKEIFQSLRKTRVQGRALDISEVKGKGAGTTAGQDKKD